jgi:hypothetical protein
MKETRAKLVHQRFSSPEEGRDRQRSSADFGDLNRIHGSTRLQLGVLYNQLRLFSVVSSNQRFFVVSFLPVESIDVSPWL